MGKRIFQRAGSCVRAASMLVAAHTSFAGGTPENAVLIINPIDAASMYVGNYYKNARNIPDANVLYMYSPAPDYSTFVSRVQAPFIDSLIERNIADHADYVVLAPTAFYMGAQTFIADPSCRQGAPIPYLSMTSAFMVSQISDRVLSGASTEWLNHFAVGPILAYPSGLPAAAFHAQQNYYRGSASTDPAGLRLYISSLLGYTEGTGNTVPEILTMIDRSVAADGSRPTTGTFYFMNNTTLPAYNTRACGGASCSGTPTVYNNTVNALASMGASAQVLTGALPPNDTTNILGVMAGFPQADIPGANLALMLGAFCDHLASHAGGLGDCPNPPNCQTALSRWIQIGASGSVGPVQEPCNFVRKYPSADFHKYYFQGMSLGEAYLRSVAWVPFEMLFYGDPLTRPFAYFPTVSVVSPPTGNQSGIISITPSATTANPGAAIAGYHLLVDGVKMASANFGQSLTLDTQRLADGRHDLRVLAYDNTPVQNVGRWIGTVDTFNYGRSATLGVSPVSGDLVQEFSFAYTVASSGLLEVRLVQNGRVLATSSNASGMLSVYGQNLGAGISKVKLEAWYMDHRYAYSIPVAVTVSPVGTPSNVIPVAYSYSKVMTSSTVHLVELPAKFDATPGVNSPLFTLLDNPTKATLVESVFRGPYRLIKPNPDATGSETLRFNVRTSGGTSNIATVTLVYTS